MDLLSHPKGRGEAMPPSLAKARARRYQIPALPGGRARAGPYWLPPVDSGHAVREKRKRRGQGRRWRQTDRDRETKTATDSEIQR